MSDTPRTTQVEVITSGRDWAESYGLMLTHARQLERESADLRGAADNALGVLIGSCLPAGGVDDLAAILDAHIQLRAALSKAQPK